MYLKNVLDIQPIPVSLNAGKEIFTNKSCQKTDKKQIFSHTSHYKKYSNLYSQTKIKVASGTDISVFQCSKAK